MKRVLFVIITTLLSVEALQAQVNKEVEVTKSYIPVIAKAEKPLLEATITDTATINPKVDYNIAPLSINTPFSSKAINPATVTYWEFNKPSKVQLKIGGGAPLNSTLGVVASTHNNGVGYLAARLDHSGVFANVKGYNGTMLDATESLNSGALNGGLYLGRKSLEMGVDYLYDIYHHHAYNQINSSKVRYQNIGAGLRFGDSFVDLSKFNFSLAGDYSHFFDGAGYSADEVDLTAKFGRATTLGDLFGGLRYNALNSPDGYMSNLYEAELSLSTSLSIWHMDLGAQFGSYDTSSFGEHDNSGYIIPKVRISTRKRGAIAPFVELDGAIAQNSFKELSTINPYTLGGLSLPESSILYSLKGGFEGQLFASRFDYRVYAEYSIEKNSRFWGLNRVMTELEDATQMSYFDVELAKQTIASFGVEGLYRLSPELEATFGVRFNDYGTPVAQNYVCSGAETEAKVGAEYSSRRFRVGVEAKYLGERRATSNTLYSDRTLDGSSVVLLPGAVNLSAYADYKCGKAISIFAKGENLCNQNIYEWALYRQFGALVTAGVKINF